MIKIKSLPLDNIRKTSDFGIRTLFNKTAFHGGIDLGIAESNKVYSVADGVVQVNGDNPTGYGYYVVVDHGDFCSLYAHLNKHLKTQGQQVSAGEIIGLSGNTGQSTGPHLHFELRDCAYARFWDRLNSIYIQCVNPWPYIEDLQKNQPCKSIDNMTIKDKWSLVASKTGLEESTINFLDAYRFREALADKLLKAMI